MSYQDFSSWQPDKERHFVVFEQHTMESSKKAWTVGMMAGAAFGVLVIIIYFMFPKPGNAHAEQSEPDLPSESKTAPAAVPATPTDPAAVPAATPTDPGATGAVAPAPGTVPGATAGAAPAGTTPSMPAPPAGATKAPPTALVGGNK